MRRIITKKNGKFYRAGIELTDDEVLEMLNNYDYALHTRVLYEREELAKERAINRHLVRENRYLLYNMERILYRGYLGDYEKEMREKLEEVDEIIKELEKVELKNEELKKQIYFLKH